MIKDYIKENLVNVHNNIDKAVNISGRDINEVKLISVSKTMPVEDLIAAYECGERDFGENKVQEIMDKIDKLPRDCRFHMIGHLQKNKVKYIVDKVYLIHSVDSYELAEVIQKEALKKNIHVNILIEVNVAREDTKFGLLPENTIDTVKRIATLSNVHIKGLMTIAPYVDSAELNRQHFVALKALAIDIKQQNIDNISMDILSMGMTGDYMVAIEEGATYIRVGTGIFGARNYCV